MEFETARQAAERLGVSVRTIQKWACNGKIPNAFKSDKSWLVPKSFEYIYLSDSVCDVDDVNKYASKSLYGADFEIGNVLDYINNIEYEECRNIAKGELCFLQGQYKEAVEILMPLIHNNNKLSYIPACICMYLKKYYMDFQELDIDEKDCKNKLFDHINMCTNNQEKAVCVFWAEFTDAAYFSDTKNLPVFEEYFKYLPNGFKLFGFYLMSYKAYIRGEYEKGAAFAEIGLMSTLKFYPIASLYCNLILTANFIKINKIKEAKFYFREALKIAKADNIIQPFVKYYNIFIELNESILKKEELILYKKLSELLKGVKQSVVYEESNELVYKAKDVLTNIEYIIAVLFAKNWKISDIAVHVGLSDKTVKSYLQSVFQKLGVNSRKDISKILI